MNPSLAENRTLSIISYNIKYDNKLDNINTWEARRNDLLNMTEEELFQIIFEPGFSTKSEVDHVSGRGIGMDVIKTSVLQLDGDVKISSKLGYGTTFEFKLPILK